MENERNWNTYENLEYNRNYHCYLYYNNINFKLLSMINLRHTGTYKDGGSKSYKDDKGNEYWFSNKFGEKYREIRYKLFKGNINATPWELARGIFILDNKKIIAQ